MASEKARAVAEPRHYERTHPWLTFQVDLSHAGYRLWLLLGEATSKCEHIATTPLKPATSRELRKVYLIKGVQGTTAIEGNTLTEDEIRRRLDGKLILPPSKEYLGREVDNIIQACEQVWADIVGGQSQHLTAEEVCQHNAMALRGLELPEEVAPGEVRSHSVGVARYLGAPPQDCEYLLRRLCDWLNDPAFCRTDAEAIVWGVIRAVLGHLYLAWIHPFGDGNGRTARLLEFRILASAGVPSPVAHLLSNHYNQTRAEYYRRLERASRDRGHGVASFLEYAIQGFVDGLKEQLAWTQRQELEIAWRDYVYEAFGDKSTPAEQRRRALVLSLSAADRPVSPQEARRLSPEVAEAYASRISRTLLRDLDDLHEMGLIATDARGIRANRDVMFAFLPARRTHDQT
ncbi:MAG: Fic family protein [Armatimonadetes bacterium]|nr:Fic family protein [Armatimonadota bacterium]